jgi:serine/threonine protein kinase
MKEDFPSVKHRQLRRWFQQTTQALYYLHSEHHTGHFDVKPENIAISKRGNAKLIDFGFSYAYENANQNQLEKLWRNRSKLYIAPELL